MTPLLLLLFTVSSFWTHQRERHSRTVGVGVGERCSTRLRPLMVLVGDNFSGQADANPSKVLGDVVAMVACCVARVLAVPGDRAVRVASQVAVLGLPD